MTNEQTSRLASVFKQIQTHGNNLRSKVIQDLRTGSVHIGKKSINNPGVPESEIEEALSELYIGLCKLSYPWTHFGSEPQPYNTEKLGDIMSCKRVVVQVLTNRRIRANRRIIEADLNHHLLVEGNAPLLFDEEEVGEFQDAFAEDRRLNVHDTKLVPNDPARKRFADYRAISPIKAKCHPSEGHFAKGWCQTCYHRVSHQIPRKNGEIPRYAASIVLRTRQVAPTVKKQLYNRQQHYRKINPPPDVDNSIVFWQEWMKTAAQTAPMEGNQYAHASVVRNINRLYQKRCNILWEHSIRKYNATVREHE